MHSWVYIAEAGRVKIGDAITSRANEDGIDLPTFIPTVILKTFNFSRFHLLHGIK